MTRRERTPHQHDKNFITELGYYTKLFPLYGKTIPYAGGFYGIGMLTKYPYINVQKIMLPKQDVRHEARALLMAERNMLCFMNFKFLFTIPILYDKISKYYALLSAAG